METSNHMNKIHKVYLIFRYFARILLKLYESEISVGTFRSPQGTAEPGRLGLPIPTPPPHTHT